MKKETRIKKGSNSYCGYSENNLYDILEYFQKAGFTKEDYKLVKLDFDFSSCYYESDTPNIRLEWSDIY